MIRYEARQNMTDDGKAYWMPYNPTKKTFTKSSVTIIGKYKNKKACEAAIRFYERCFF